MRLLKPNWVEHDGRPIFSVDIHPDGSRFATGGQGDDCGQVVIWNMAPVRDQKAEENENVPKILCQMDNHLACVNCVRWSHNGKFLASGGDDKLVMVWQTSRYIGPSSTFGSNKKVVNIEQWRPVFTLRGHSGDVLDISWSPHDAWLASCSVDNTIVVWNTIKFPEQVAVLKGHTGLVKGVTWDPVGKYLASQSDDKTLRVWRTRDWQTEAVISEPFVECGGTTHVLRLDWSPDGHYVVSAHAMNNSGPTAQIIEREGWKVTLDFVGHRKAITVVRFNPNIFEKKIKKDSDKTSQYSCCAIGSKDRSISIWLTALKRPLVVTHDLFESSIMDISWSKNGFELICCSIDGTVAFIDFSVDEIGSSLSQQEVQTVLERIYGKGLPLRSMMNSGNQIIESAAMLNLQQQKQKESQETKQTPTKLPATSPQTPKHCLSNGDVPFKPLDKQIETRTPDGRRRITPIFLAPQPDFGEGPLPFPGNVVNTDSNISFATSKDHSKIQVEKQDRVTIPGLVSPSSKSTTSPQTGSNLSEPKPSPINDMNKKAGGDKKSSETSVFQPMTALEKTPEKSDKEKISVSTPSDKQVDKDKLKDKPPGLTLKRKAEDKKDKSKVGRPKKDKESKDYERIQPSTVTSAPVERTVIRSFSPSNELSLPVPTIDKSASILITGNLGDDNCLNMEVENNVQCGLATVHKLRYIKGGETLWEQVLTSRINIAAGSSCISCASSEDHSVVIFSAGGRKLFPNIILDSKISYLYCSGFYVMAVTQKGSLFVWNMQTKCAAIKNESISSLINGNVKVEKAILTTDGHPIITLSNTKSYSYQQQLGCWVLVHENINNVIQCSDFQCCKPPSDGKVKGPLISLQTANNRFGMQASRTSSSTSSVQQTATVSHLENQVAVCLGLQSADEYKFWFLSYVKYLVQEGFEVKLREVCDDLLGPLIKKKVSSWQPYILGLDKHDLLREILPIIGSNLRWQRLYTEYHEQLDST